jgi:murein DD-endopeptidase MepM/ murein hydrolase activator NlpD
MAVGAEALARAETARQAAEEAKQALDELKASLQSLTERLESEKATAQAKTDQLEAERKQVEADLDKVLEEERRKAGVSPPSSGGSPPSTPGFFGRPLNSISVVSPFGMRWHPIYHTQRFHMGVDLSAGCGTPIFASAAGTVIFTGWGGANGNRIVVSHGNVNGSLMFSTYNHIVDGGFLVSNGQQVSKGQQIARVGTTGASTGCHLHFEIGVNTAANVVNPMNYIS